MTRQFFFAPVVLPRYNARHKQRFTVGAASHKVAGMAASVRSQGQKTLIVSSPIVTASPVRVFFKGFACREGRVPCVYLPSISMRGLNRLFSSFAYLWFAWREIRRDDGVVFYNYFPEYILLAAWLRLRNGRERVVIDLEDGPRTDENDLRGFFNRASFRILTRLCSKRAIVVSQQLATMLGLSDVCVINGVSPEVTPRTRDFQNPVVFLYGGSIQLETGLQLFIEAVRLFAHTHGELASQVHFMVTGFGGAAQLNALAQEVRPAGVQISVRQDIDPEEYRRMLADADVGMSLRVPGDQINGTTFPSKVIELTSHGLLLLTTEVSDIAVLFKQDTAVILAQATPQILAERIAAIARDPGHFAQVAAAGQGVITARCSRDSVGRRLVDFLKPIRLGDVS
jgi:glycosyltransferase involved in cell wall biosynthesis